MRLSKEKTKVLILSHFLINPLQNNSAFSTAMREFLVHKVKKVVQIEQPFPNSKDSYLYFINYENGRLNKKLKVLAIKKPDWLAYSLHPFITLRYVLRTSSKYDLAIACENLSFIAAWPLRRLGIIKKLIYYSIDYIDERFQNRLLNIIYHALDEFACKHSDANWVVAQAQIDGRKTRGMNIKRCAPFSIVPIGFRLKEISIPSISKVNYYQLVFCGTLRESAGPQLVIESLPLIAKKFPKIKVTFVGSGEYKQDLVKLARNLKVSERVKFLTNVKSHKKLVQILTHGSIGLAPYAPVPGSLSYHSDPGKIKLYLACGLPVITTQIATSGPLIARQKAGAVINFEADKLYKAVSFLLSNRKIYLRFKNAARELSKQYDIDEILSSAINDLALK